MMHICVSMANRLSTAMLMLRAEWSIGVVGAPAFDDAQPRPICERHCSPG